MRPSIKHKGGCGSDDDGSLGKTGDGEHGQDGEYDDWDEQEVDGKGPNTALSGSSPVNREQVCYYSGFLIDMLLPVSFHIFAEVVSTPFHLWKGRKIVLGVFWSDSVMSLLRADKSSELVFCTGCPFFIWLTPSSIITSRLRSFVQTNTSCDLSWNAVEKPQTRTITVQYPPKCFC